MVFPALVIAVVIALLSAVTTPTSSLVTSQRSPDLADGSVSFLVVDRVTGQVRAERNAHTRYRSASLVKLLIALDYFESPAQRTEIPEDDRALLEPMLRFSDDEAANVLWSRQGGTEIVRRMVDRLGLTDTTPPADGRIWGYTEISAADVVRIYRHLLDRTTPLARDFVLGNLGAAPRCAGDGRDQYFGIPGSVDGRWAVKQGWSGYAEVEPGRECATEIARDGTDPALPRSLSGLQNALGDPVTDAEAGVERYAMHTTGTVGADHDTIVVVLSGHGPGTSYEDAAERLTTITRVLDDAVIPPDADRNAAHRACRESHRLTGPR